MAQDDNHDLLGEAQLLYDNGDYGDAFRIYRELADRGDVIAQGSLGWMYSVGHGVEQDLQQAENCYSQAAEHGDAYAQNGLGNIHTRQGEHEKALPWYQKAARQGYSPAIYRLAVIYEFGRGVPIDKQRAFELFKQAYEMGNMKAQREYAKRLIRGYFGIWGVINGAYLIFDMFIMTIRIGYKDIHDTRLRG